MSHRISRASFAPSTKHFTENSTQIFDLKKKKKVNPIIIQIFRIYIFPLIGSASRWRNSPSALISPPVTGKKLTEIPSACCCCCGVEMRSSQRARPSVNLSFFFWLSLHFVSSQIDFHPPQVRKWFRSPPMGTQLIGAQGKLERRSFVLSSRPACTSSFTRIYVHFHFNDFKLFKLNGST